MQTNHSHLEKHLEHKRKNYRCYMKLCGKWFQIRLSIEQSFECNYFSSFSFLSGSQPGAIFPIPSSFAALLLPFAQPAVPPSCPALFTVQEPELHIAFLQGQRWQSSPAPWPLSPPDLGSCGTVSGEALPECCVLEGSSLGRPSRRGASAML